MPLLFLFLDGIGLGADDPAINPLARASMPFLRELLGGRPMVRQAAPYTGAWASLLALDACLGVEGLPQSATGQATLLSGQNIPQAIGYHYGPKPNAEIAAHLKRENLFLHLHTHGRRAALLNAYPPHYFHSIQSGHRLYSAIPLSVTAAGLPLFGIDEFFSDHALSADLTGEAWRSLLGFPQAPIRPARDAGHLMAKLASEYDFSFFEYWASDYAGHRQDMDWAIRQLETLDSLLQGLCEASPPDLLILITSDHGNLEDLSTRRHTTAAVPLLLIGPSPARAAFHHAT
ncbi:MAG: peptidase, partial [Anaerolineales bacterium]